MNRIFFLRWIIVIGLPFLLVACGEPLSHDATKDGLIAYAHEHQICKVNSDGTGRSVLVEDKARTFGWVRWSPDGKQLAYAAFSESGRKDEKAELWTIGHDGKGRNKIETWASMDSEPIVLPFWSPDGTKLGMAIAEDTGKEDQPKFSILIYDLKTEKKKRLEDAFFGYCAKFSPDGKQLLYAKTPRYDDRFLEKTTLLGEISVYHLETDADKPLVACVFGYFYPYFEWLDGDQILLAAPSLVLPLALRLDEDKMGEDRLFRQTIYRLDLRDRSLSPVIPGNASLYFALSPNRKRLLYLAKNEKESGIVEHDAVMVADADGKKAKEIWKDNANMLPCWAGDDKVVVGLEREQTDQEKKKLLEWSKKEPNRIYWPEKKASGLMVIDLVTGKQTEIRY